MTLELYHAPLSTCSQRVRLVLAEKGLEWVDHRVDLGAGEQLEPAYLRLNPDGVVPTLVHDGRVLVESSLINEYLEECFSEPALRPADPLERHRMRAWVRLLDERIQPACSLLTYALGLRPLLLSRPREQWEAQLARMPDAARREARRSALELGPQAPGVPDALRAHVGLLERLEATLGEREWLAGGHFSLAEAAVLPYLLRLEHLGLEALLASRPALTAWYQRLQQRPSFTRALVEPLPQPLVAAMRRAAQAQAATLEPLLRPPDSTPRGTPTP